MKRRKFLAASALAGAATLSACQVKSDDLRPQITDESQARKTYVLVHGAWHGGWCWRDVRNKLEDAGHRVFTPTLTGLGERVHLLSPETGLDTHINDIIQHIIYEDLSDVILVGHSYGGMVITGVIDRLKDRISHIVYLDAAVPDDGENFASQAPIIDKDTVKLVEDSFRSLSQDGLTMDVFPATLLGIPETDTESINWVTKHMTPHPLKTWLDPVSLENNGSEGAPRTYIHCVKPAMEQASFAAHYANFQQDPTWNTLTLETGHDAMVTASDHLTEILHRL